MRGDIDPYKLATALLGFPGRMLSGSKTAPPERRVVWNGNVVVGKRVPIKIWYGDISITDSESELQELADKLDATVYVLYEMDARFDTATSPRISEAVATFTPRKEDD